MRALPTSRSRDVVLVLAVVVLAAVVVEMVVEMVVLVEMVVVVVVVVGGGRWVGDGGLRPRHDPFCDRVIVKQGFLALLR